MLVNRRADAVPLVRFASLRCDSIDSRGISTVRWKYRTGATAKVPVHATAGTAAASMASGETSHVPDADDAEHFFQPLAPSAEVKIAAKHMLKLKALEVTVGAIASVRGAVGSMGWIVLDPAPEIELIDVDIHSDPEHQGKVKVKTPGTVNPAYRPQVLADGDEADGGDEIEAVADGSATRASMRGNPMHQRPQALDEAAASDLDLDKSPSDKKRRESHFTAKDRRRLKKRERLDKLKDRAATSNAGANREEEETRAADDGGIYTQTQFVEHYGGTSEWDAARTI